MSDLDRARCDFCGEIPSVTEFAPGEWDCACSCSRAHGKYERAAIDRYEFLQRSV